MSLTLTRNTSSPLRGSADFKLSHSAENDQGKGISYDFTIDSADQSKPMYISGDYKVSANYSYTNNDLVFYIYDITNAVMIQPVPYVLDGSGKFKFEFQSNAGSTSYRLIFHIATTNASAWDFNFVNVIVSATPLPSMINVLDKQYDISSYVTGTGISSVDRAVAVPYKTKTGIWRLKGNVKVTFSSGAQYKAFLITGITTAAAKQAFSCCGDSQDNGYVGLTSASYNDFNMYAVSSRTVWEASFDIELASMPTWAVDYYPVSLSDGAETRVITARAYRQTSGITLSTSATEIIFNTSGLDTHSAYNISNGRFIVPVSGKYSIRYNLWLTQTATANSSVTSYILKNGTGFKYGFNQIGGGMIIANSYFPMIGEVVLDLIAGDYISIFALYSGGTAPFVAWNDGSSDATYINIECVSGLATISAGEFVGAKYSRTTSTQSLPNTTTTRLGFNNKVYDTHNAQSGTDSTWLYTIPISGYYRIYSQIEIGPSNSWANKIVVMTITKNGGNTIPGSSKHNIINTSTIDHIQVDCETETYLLADETIEIYCYHDNGGGNVMQYSNNNSFITISKLNK